MSLSIWLGGHIYGPRLGTANKICSALGLFDIWPGCHIYGCASAEQIKFALLSAYSYICKIAKNKPLGLCARRSVIVNEI